MRKSLKYVGLSTLFFCGIFVIWQSWAIEPIQLSEGLFAGFTGIQPDTIINQDNELPYPIEENTGNPYNTENTSPLYLRDPSNITTEVIYNPETGEYIYQRKVGELGLSSPVTMTLDDYSQYQLEKSKREYWSQKARSSEFQDTRSFVPSFQIRNEAFDKVFGSNTINITPQGSAEVIFGFTMNRIDNPQLSERLRRTPSFTFKEKIQMNVTGSIGDKMEMGINYNTEATFDFENKTKLEYTGDEDEIIKKIEAGNVSLSLPGSLITGSQSLFGVKTELQFGKLTMTTVLSHQKGESSVIEVEGGAQVSEFEVSVDDYDANRHFFLSHYFKERYDKGLSDLPTIKSSVQIEDLEVWVTNKTKNFDGARNIVALVDIGEIGNNITNNSIRMESQVSDSLPTNSTNTLYSKLVDDETIRDIGTVSSALKGYGLDSGEEFEKIESARKLSSSEYTLNSTLGYISLNTALNSDEVLAVAYRYKVSGEENYRKVGELTDNAPSAPQTIIVKLLKGTNLSPRYKTWGLMMKNIYAIGAYQVSSNDFNLNIFYLDDENGQYVNYLPGDRTGNEILLRVFGLDKLNSQSDPYPDGLFDYISGTTIIPSKGRIIFPTVEPFGESLKTYLTKAYGGSYLAYQDSIDPFLFTELYDSTKTKAQQISEKNKFVIAGKYSGSSGSEIQLNAMNIPQGSVVVTANGVQLAENVDYTVDYTLGRVTIINSGLLESGTPIKIALESNTLFNLQRKTLVGTHLNYQFSDDFYLGGTVLHLKETPLTKKVNYGDEPISNTIWGLNGAYRTESQFLTTLVDKLPFLETKEKSSINIDGEFAQLIPGSSKSVGKNGKVYIDDFEGSETSIDMKSTYSTWVLASTPQNQSRFPESFLDDNLAYGFNRAKIAWYVIDDLFQETSSLTPSHIKSDDDERSNHFVRTVLEQEIFPDRESENNIPTRLSMLNVAYYPDERGAYNFDTEASAYSQGVDEDGYLKDPESRWGGIMRQVLTTDFEAANIEFIEFWMLDPFAMDTSAYDNPDYLGTDPSLYFDLGNISEDILKDSRKSFENGLPTDADPVDYLDTTSWGLVSSKTQYQNAFDTDSESRQYQDVGLDGMSTTQEQEFFKDDYLDKLESLYGTNSNAYASAYEDPANDDFHYYRGSDYDDEKLGVLERYKKYNNYEENSRTADNSVESYSTTGKNSPDVEDINNDNTLSEGESYFEYKISLRPDMLDEVGENYITDIVTATPELENGTEEEVRWIQFKVPLEDFEDTQGSIEDFSSIRFMRMYMHGIGKEVILRFAELNLVRSEWRKYESALYEAIEYVEDQDEQGSLDISAVNIEENGDKEPVNYILPPGSDREIDPSNPQIRQLNEQAMVLKVENLSDGDARAAYKTVGLDLRQYKKLTMDVHAEELTDGTSLEDGELAVFVRLGSDYVNNFYEYEIPLIVTPPGTYNSSNEDDRYIVWPDSNRMEIDLDVFTDVKLLRNEERRQENSTVELTTIYESYDGNNRVLIRGNPSLSNVKTIMIGVRNPKRSNYLQEENDGYSKSGEIWVNELRLTDFRDKGGWAANARVKANLADFGTVTVAGAASTPGFGSIEQQVSERSMEEVTQYDVATNLELGKFFPEKAGVSIPLYVGYSKATVTPEYNPLDPDILLEEALEQEGLSEEEKDAIRDYAIEETTWKSFNLTNVRVNKSSKNKQLYDPANFSMSYSYNEKTYKDINTKNLRELEYGAAFNYNYSSRPKNVAPFSKVKQLNNPYLKLIKDFNFYYSPSRISFRTDLNREYTETTLRNLTSIGDLDYEIELPTTVYKDYTWNRYYDLKFDLTRALKLDFSATNLATFDESSDTLTDFGFLGLKPDYNPDYKKSNFGRTLNYYHTIKLSYTVPINKIPLFSWTNLNTQYSSRYNWQAGPQLEADEDPNYAYGNTISNSYTFSINSSNRLTTLYNKVSYFKTLEQKYSARGKSQQKKEYKTVTFTKENLVFKANTPRSIQHKLKTEDVKVKVLDEDGKELDAEVKVVDEEKVYIMLEQDMRRITVQVEGQVEKKPNPLQYLADQSIRILIGVKDINVSYSQTHGTILPGYLRETSILGFDDISGAMAPGVKFVLGLQEKNFLKKAKENGWLTKNEYQLSPYTTTKNSNVDIRSTFEPFKGFKVTLNANRSRTINKSRTFSYNSSTDDVDIYSEIEQGSFSISTITIRTAFEKFTSDNDYKSAAFERFKELRKEVSVIRAKELKERGMFPTYDPYGGDYESGYTVGYGSTSKEVLVPAFLAAYTKQGLNNRVLNKFPEIPMPNWRLTFDGLSKIEYIQKYVRSINISHSYRSRYNIGNYGSNLDYEVLDGLPAFDLQGNFLNEIEIEAVSIEEQLSPLIGMDMSWHNSLTSKFEINKTRSLSLNFANNQLIELNSNELVIGAGYSIKDVELVINAGSGQKAYKSDLNIRADLSIRDSKTIIRNINIEEDESSDDVTAGERRFTIKTTMDYQLSESFNVSFYFDRVMNTPATSLSYPYANTNIGFSVRFTLIP